MDNKLNLIKLSTKAWHFKLNRYIFGHKMINTSMNNLCPYFWLLVAAMFLVTIVGPIDYLIIKPINWLIKKISVRFKKMKERRIHNWLMNLPLEAATCIWDSNGDMTNIGRYYLPNYILNSKYDHRSFFIYLTDVLNLNYSKWKEIHDEYDEDTNQYVMKYYEEINKVYNTKARVKETRSKTNESIDKFFNGILTSIENFFSRIKKGFTFNNTAKIIKITKRFIGGIITGGLLFVLFFVVNGISRAILWCIENWNGPIFREVMTNILIILAIIIVLALIVFLIQAIVDWLKTAYKSNSNNIIFNIVYFIFVKIIYGFIYYILWISIKFIIQGFLWKILCIGIIWNSLKSFWDGLMSVSGIFGEYFGRSKGDYCPGIEWENKD